MRIPIIAANWKMNTTLAGAGELVLSMRDELSHLVAGGREQIVLCPQFISLARVADLVEGTGIEVGAQNMMCAVNASSSSIPQPAQQKTGRDRARPVVRYRVTRFTVGSAPPSTN